MAKTQASNCHVCAVPARRAIDRLLFQGLSEEEIVEMKRDCGLTADEIKAHREARHVEFDRGAASGLLICMMRDLRQMDSEIGRLALDDGPWLTDPAKSRAEGKIPEAVEIGTRIALLRARESRLIGCRIKQIEAGMRVLSIVVRMVKLLPEAEGPRTEQERIDALIAADPGLIERLKAVHRGLKHRAKNQCKKIQSDGSGSV